jgi:hypothetical protein
MESKKASALLLTLIIISAIGFFASFGFLLTKKVIEKRLPEIDTSQFYFDNATFEQVEESGKSISFTPWKTTITRVSDDEEGENETSSGDTSPPASITNLAPVSSGVDWIQWSWTNPPNPDFSSCILYIEKTGQTSTRINAGTTSSASYTTGNLIPNTQYILIVYTKDNSQNINATGVTATASTLADTSPPASITNLYLVSRTHNSLTWAWTNPADSDFNDTVILINSANSGTSSSSQYTATNLAQNTQYTITVQSRDTSGNLGTGVSNAQRTCIHVCGVGGQCYIKC